MVDFCHQYDAVDTGMLKELADFEEDVTRLYEHSKELKGTQPRSRLNKTRQILDRAVVSTRVSLPLFMDDHEIVPLFEDKRFAPPPIAQGLARDHNITRHSRYGGSTVSPRPPKPATGRTPQSRELRTPRLARTRDTPSSSLSRSRHSHSTDPEDLTMYERPRTTETPRSIEARRPHTCRPSLGRSSHSDKYSKGDHPFTQPFVVRPHKAANGRVPPKKTGASTARASARAHAQGEGDPSFKPGAAEQGLPTNVASDNSKSHHQHDTAVPTPGGSGDHLQQHDSTPASTAGAAGGAAGDEGGHGVLGNGEGSGAHAHATADGGTSGGGGGGGGGGGACGGGGGGGEFVVETGGVGGHAGNVDLCDPGVTAGNEAVPGESTGDGTAGVGDESVGDVTVNGRRRSSDGGGAGATVVGNVRRRSGGVSDSEEECWEPELAVTFADPGNARSSSANCSADGLSAPRSNFQSPANLRAPDRLAAFDLFAQNRILAPTAGFYKRICDMMELVASVSAHLDNFKRTVRTVREAAVQLLSAEHAIVFVVDTPRRELEAFDGSTQTSRSPVMKGCAGYVASTGKPLHLLTAGRQAKRFDESIDAVCGERTVLARSWMAMPLLCADNSVYGVLAVMNSTSLPREFTTEDELLLNLLARQSGLSLKNSEDYGIMAKSKKQTAAIVKSISDLSKDTDEASVVATVTRVLKKVLGSDSCALFLVDDDKNIQLPPNASQRLSACAIEVLKQGRLVNSRAENQAAQSWMGVPVLDAKGLCRGILCALQKSAVKHAAFTRQQEASLLLVRDAACTALEACLWRRQVLHVQSSMAEITNGSDLDATLDAIRNKVSALLKCDFCAVIIRETTRSGALALFAPVSHVPHSHLRHNRDDDDELPNGRVLVTDIPSFARVVDTSEPLTIADLTSETSSGLGDSELVRVQRLVGSSAASLVAVPLVRARGGSLGAIVVAVNDASAPLDKSTEFLLRCMGGYAGPIVEQTIQFSTVATKHALCTSLQQNMREQFLQRNHFRVLELVAIQAQSMIHCSRVVCFAVDAKAVGNELAMYAHDGVLRYSWQRGLIGACARSGEVINCSQPHSDTRLDPEVDQRGYDRVESLLCCPIVHSFTKEVLAVVQLLHRPGSLKYFSAQDELLMQSIVHVAGVALQNCVEHNATLADLRHLENALHQTQKVFHRMAGFMATSGDLFEVLKNAMAYGRELLDATVCNVYLLDDSRDQLHLLSAVNGEILRTLCPSSELAACVAATAEVVLCVDATIEPRFDAHAPHRLNDEIDNLIACPITNTAGDTIGVYEVCNKCGSSFVQSDAIVLQVLARLVALTLDNSERMQRYDRVHACLLQVSVDLSVDSAVDVIRRCAAEVCDAETATLFHYDTAQGLLSYPDETRSQVLVPLRTGIVGEVAVEGTPVLCADPHRDPRFLPTSDVATHGRSIRNIMCVPVKDHTGRTLAVLELFNRKYGCFTQTDLQYVELLSAQAGITLRNAQLFSGIVAREQKTIGFTHVAISLCSETNLKSLSRSLLPYAMELLHASEAFLYIVDAKSDKLIERYDRLGFFKRVLKNGVCGRVLLTGGLINTMDRTRQEDSRSRQRSRVSIDQVDDQEPSQEQELFVGGNPKNRLCSPLFKYSGEILGVIELENSLETAMYNVGEEELMMELCNVASAAIQICQRSDGHGAGE